MFNKINFVRSGGIGDILMATPSFRALKYLYPSIPLDIYTKEINFPLLKSNRNIAKLHNFDTHISNELENNKVYNLEGKLEDFSHSLNKLNRIDAIAKHCGLELKDHFIELSVDPKTEKWVNAYLDFNVPRSIPLIGLALFGEFRVRSWTYRNIYELANYFDRTKYRLVLFGEQHNQGFELPGVLNTCGLLHLEQYIALIKQCAFMLTVDSSALHIAAAFNIPTLALFGSLPAETRISHYPGCRALTNNNLKCVPCWEWQDVDSESHSYCMNKEVRCLSEISPLRVYQETIQYLKELEKNS